MCKNVKITITYINVKCVLRKKIVWLQLERTNNNNLPVVLQLLLEIYPDHPGPWCAARRHVPAHTGVYHSPLAPSPSLGEPFSAQPDIKGLLFST